jgi:hypothetical protein
MLVERVFQYVDDKSGDALIRVVQDGDSCEAVMADTGEPYARISCVVEKQTPIEGWFWLKWWSENEELVRQLVNKGVLQTRDDKIIAVSRWVNTCEARVVEEE